MATDIVVPELGVSVVEATVVTWFKNVGDPVSVGETLVELETDKVNLEVSASTAGVLARIEQQEGVDVQIGDLLGVIDESAEAVATASDARDAVQSEATPSTSPSEPEEPPAETDEATEHDDRVTPVARRMAEESGVDLAGIEGTGAGGRITKQDVEQSVTAKQQPMPEQQPSAPEPASEAAEEIIPMSRRRRTIAKRLVEAQQTAAMLTTFNEIDMSTVISVRGSKKEAFEARHGVRLGFMSFFVKAAIGGLKDFPLLNAEIRDDNFVVKRHYDIGMAVGAEEGLVVPVLRAADQMSFAGIEKTIRILAGKARDGSLAIEDLRGGTFTITNGGVFGSLLSTPILNPPQVGILGLHKIDERPIAINGEVVIRPMMYVALSYDHRIVDGSEAVRFLVRVKELIEDPAGLLLDG